MWKFDGRYYVTHSILKLLAYRFGLLLSHVRKFTWVFTWVAPSFKLRNTSWLQKLVYRLPLYVPRQDTSKPSGYSSRLGDIWWIEIFTVCWKLIPLFCSLDEKGALVVLSGWVRNHVLVRMFSLRSNTGFAQVISDRLFLTEVVLFE